MSEFDYWKEAVAIGAEEVGLTLTEDQIESIANSVEGAHDNYSMAFGYDVASANFISDEKKELDRIKAEQEKTRLWKLSTKPCSHCTTTGWVTDGWGRDIRCDWCSGEGRV